MQGIINNKSQRGKPVAVYNTLSKELQERIEYDRHMGWKNPYACADSEVVRRYEGHDKPFLWRPVFVSDVEKILHNPYYNRYSDKTQVFSLYKNDDISRRAYHVQLVARIARNIGSILGLNNDLIEAISLGHDMGHTPFGHDGERILDELYCEKTGRRFFHNVHSVRVLDKLICRNISLQTLDGVVSHNGEMELKEYRPTGLKDFSLFDEKIENCYLSKEANERSIPSTLEGCVMRICDIIAYLGKDRQDAERLKVVENRDIFSALEIGQSNAEIINNLIVNIVENSYGKDYLCMDDEFFKALKLAKKENYQFIYGNVDMKTVVDSQIKPMFACVYEALLKQALDMKKDSILYTHHIEFLKEQNMYQSYFDIDKYMEEEKNQIVVDYMASMTDDYLIELYDYLFPKGNHKVEYKGYF